MKLVFRRRFAACASLLILAGIGATKIPISWNYLTPITITAQETTTVPSAQDAASSVVALTDSEGNTLARSDAKFLIAGGSPYVQKAYPTARAGKTERVTLKFNEPVRSQNGSDAVVYIYLAYTVTGGSGNPDDYLSQKQTAPLRISSADGASGKNQKTTFNLTLKSFPAAAAGATPRLNVQIFLRDSPNISASELGVPDGTFSLDLLGG